MSMVPMRRPLALMWTTTFVIAGTAASASVPAAAAPTHSLTRTSCASKAEKKRIYKGATKRKVRRIVGARGNTLRSTGRTVVRGYPACQSQKTVIVKFRSGRVVSVKTRSQLTQADIDGNGTVDYWFDANADGHFEMAVLDTNGNGVFETSSSRGRRFNSSLGTATRTVRSSIWASTARRTAASNWILLDENEDGVADLMAVDLVGSDGVADTWINARSASSYTPPGLSTDQMREANDRMVQHIVTLQQLRQFDPWDTNWYVSDAQTPSLLLPGTSPEPRLRTLLHSVTAGSRACLTISDRCARQCGLGV